MGTAAVIHLHPDEWAAPLRPPPPPLRPGGGGVGGKPSICSPAAADLLPLQRSGNDSRLDGHWFHQTLLTKGRCGELPDPVYPHKDWRDREVDVSTLKRHPRKTTSRSEASLLRVDTRCSHEAFMASLLSRAWCDPTSSGVHKTKAHATRSSLITN